MTDKIDMTPDVMWLLFNSAFMGLIALMTFGFPQARGFHAGKHGIGSPGDIPLFFLALVEFLFGHAVTFYIGFQWGGFAP